MSRTPTKEDWAHKCSTTNQHNRKGRYHPHVPIISYNPYADKIDVKCAKCGKSWTHDRGAIRAPSECKR